MTVYIKNEKTVIVSFKINEKEILREVYSFNLGKLLEKCKDSIIDSNTFRRKIINLSLTINNSNVISFKISHKLECIKNKFKPIKDASNPNIGSFDLETYTN